MNEEDWQALKQCGEGILEHVKSIESLQFQLEDEIDTLLSGIRVLNHRIQTADLRAEKPKEAEKFQGYLEKIKKHCQKYKSTLAVKITDDF